MSYTFEQLERISRTIFQYEAERLVIGNDPVCSANVLVTGNPSEQISWLHNTRLGALPTCLPLTEKVLEKGDHPLDFAAAFLDHLEVCQVFLDAYKRELGIAADSASFGFRSGTHYFTTRTIPPPKDTSMRVDVTRLPLFHPLHAAWYTPRVITQLTTEYLTYRYGVGHFLGQVGYTLDHAGQSTALLEHIATKVLLIELGKRANATTDLAGLAEMVRLADSERVEEKLLDTKGVYQTLGIALQRSSPEMMIASLKALAKYKHPELLRCFGRAPTVEELRKANVTGMVTLWYYMPWSILGPLVKENGGALRAALLKRSEASYDELSACLLDHPKRVTLNSESERLVDLRVLQYSSTSAKPFDIFKERALQYFDAVRVRTILAETYPLEVRRLIAFRHLTNREDIAEYVDPLLTDAVRHALAAYPSPLSERAQKRAQLPI